MEHYFIEKQHSADDYFEFDWQFFDWQFVFESCDDVFSKNQVDYGTYILLKTIYKKVNLIGYCLDIGCGYGVIGIVLSKIFPNTKFVLSDVNPTSVSLSKTNIQKNVIKGIDSVILSNAYQNINKTFDFIISNPPIKAGKKVLLEILLGSYDKLNNNGKLIFVIKKKFGEDSIKKQLQSVFKTVEVINRDSGYYILEATK